MANLSGNRTLTQSFLGRNLGASNVSKNLEKKFERTRLILKEEGKMQRYEKIQSIYDKKKKPKFIRPKNQKRDK